MEDATPFPPEPFPRITGDKEEVVIYKLLPIYFIHPSERGLVALDLGHIHVIDVDKVGRYAKVVLDTRVGTQILHRFSSISEKIEN